MNKKILIGLSIILIVIITVGGILMHNAKNDNNINEIEYANGEFNLNLIKTVNNGRNKNYLISPYSIEIALNLLREGADGNTLTEINNVIGNRSINDITIKNRVSVANAAFIKNQYKKYVLDSYYKVLTNKYQSEILYDDFDTPKVINDWVNNKTNGMIKEILSNIDKDYVLGLANALAIDVEWDSAFECQQTTSEKFNKIDGTVINVEMMHKVLEYSDYKYLKSEDAIGVVIPYKKYDSKTGEDSFDSGRQLEFMAILPNDNLHNYINNLTRAKLDMLDTTSREVSDDFEIELALPRFRYDYDLNDFKDVLINMGIKDAFDPDMANFTKMIKRSEAIPNLYVGEAIHKTHIDLNEKGTKAAAVTYFGMFKATGMLKEKETVRVTFDKPFLYMIRDKESKEVLFFGTVYEPNKWVGSTCSSQE